MTPNTPVRRGHPDRPVEDWSHILEELNRAPRYDRNARNGLPMIAYRASCSCGFERLVMVPDTPRVLADDEAAVTIARHCIDLHATIPAVRRDDRLGATRS